MIDEVPEQVRSIIAESDDEGLFVYQAFKPGHVAGAVHRHFVDADAHANSPTISKL